MIADQPLAVFHFNPDIVAFWDLHQIHIGDDTQLIANFRRQMLEQLPFVLKRERLAIIIETDAQRSPICICKCAQPLEIIVILLPFPFNVLVFFHIESLL